jgi:hypothetical protein
MLYFAMPVGMMNRKCGFACGGLACGASNSCISSIAADPRPPGKIQCADERTLQPNLIERN